MTNELLIEEYRKFLQKQRNSSGQPYSSKYVGDKISRTKKMLTVISAKSIENIDEESYFKLVKKLMDKFDGVYPLKNNPHRHYKYHKYSDLLVILRQLYLMKTNKKAPIFTHYAGKLRERKD